MRLTRRQPRHRQPSNHCQVARRACARATTVAAGTALASSVVSSAAYAAEGPPTPQLTSKRVDRLGDYVPQRLCDPTPKPGTVAFANLMLTHYHAGHSGGIVRSCGIGGTSEHKEGRAWDWMLDAGDPAERAVADEFVDWLTERGPDGERGYNARRLGVMYVIWNRRIWGTYRAAEGWRPYHGASPHTDHVHVSLTWAGAMQRSSWWTGSAKRTQREDSPAAAAATSVSPGRSAGGTRYTVVSGDTLSELAAQFRTSVGEIQDANGLTGDLIRVGQVLVIPA